jgi:hypothetical protein
MTAAFERDAALCAVRLSERTALLHSAMARVAAALPAAADATAVGVSARLASSSVFTADSDPFGLFAGVGGAPIAAAADGAADASTSLGVSSRGGVAERQLLGEIRRRAAADRTAAAEAVARHAITVEHLAAGTRLRAAHAVLDTPKRLGAAVAEETERRRAVLVSCLEFYRYAQENEPRWRCDAARAAARAALWGEAARRMAAEFESEEGFAAALCLAAEDEREEIAARVVRRASAMAPPPPPPTVSANDAQFAHTVEPVHRDPASLGGSQRGSSATIAAAPLPDQHTVDLSHGSLTAVPAALPAAALTLNMSHNRLGSLQGMPVLPQLHTLWISDNQLPDSVHIVGVLRARCPGLRHLMLLGNPCAPHTMPGDMAQGYRAFVANKLPQVTVLDFMSITADERRQGEMRFGHGV